MISYQSENVTVPKFPRRAVGAWIRRVAAKYGKRVGDVAYIFCNDARILEVNRQYLQHDYYTDIITFDYTEADTIGGDIFISLDTVASNAVIFDKEVGDAQTAFRQELMRVIIHGILHLCGIDDKGPGQREVMERHENEALALYCLS